MRTRQAGLQPVQGCAIRQEKAICKLESRAGANPTKPKSASSQEGKTPHTHWSQPRCTAFRGAGSPGEFPQPMTCANANGRNTPPLVVVMSHGWLLLPRLTLKFNSQPRYCWGISLAMQAATLSLG